MKSTTTLILGGSKGLGQQLVQQSQAAGHQVYEMSRSGSGQHHVDLDLAQVDPTQVEHILSEIESDAIHLIINAAVLAPFGHLAEQDPTDISKHIDVNIQGTLRFLSAFVTRFQSSPAEKTITYLSSGAARRAIPGMALYCASKAFFERYFETFADEQEAWPHPFRCLVVNPGVMHTDMQSEIRQQSAHDFPMVDWWHTLHKENKLADPADIAAVCWELINTGQSGHFIAQELMKSKD